MKMKKKTEYCEDNGFNTITMKILLDSLIKNQSIEVLNLSKNSLNGKQIKLFDSYLQSTKKLKKLYLSGKFIDFLLTK